MALRLNMAFLLPLLLAPAGAVQASELASLRVRSVSPDLPKISVYFDLLDEENQPAPPPQLDQLTLTIGPSPTQSQSIQRFEQTRTGIAYIFLVDISKSFALKKFAQLKTVLKNWVQALTQEDAAAVLTFGQDVKLVQDFTRDKNRLLEAVELKPTDNLTQLHQGFLRAMAMGKRADPDLPQYRVIVTLSDGQEDFPGGVTHQEVNDRLKEDRVPIYALGFSSASPTPTAREALQALGVLARTSGGEYLAATGARLDVEYEALRRRIRQVFVAQFECPACEADGQLHRVQLSYTNGTKIFTDGLSVRLLPRLDTEAPTSIEDKSPPGNDTPAHRQKNWWLYAAAGILLIAVSGAVLLLRKPARYERTEQDEQNERNNFEGQAERDGLGEQKENIVPEGLSSTLSNGTNDTTGIQVRFTPVGERIGAPEFKTHLIDRIVIGRHTECTVVITDDLEVSGHHCELIRADAHIFVRDLNSRNGTLVNGIPISGRHKL